MSRTKKLAPGSSAKHLEAFLAAFLEYLQEGGDLYWAVPASPTTFSRLAQSFLDRCRQDSTLLATAAATDLALDELAYNHEVRMTAGRPETTEIAIVRAHLTRCRDTVQLLRGQALVDARYLERLRKK